MAKEKATEEKTKTIKVKVKDIPVLHNGESFEPGQAVEIDENHFNEALFEKE